MEWQRIPAWLVGVILMLMLGAIGTTGYVLIEDWTPGEAFYMTVISLTTVGYGEVRELSPAGRWFTIGILTVGIGLVTYVITQAARIMVEGGMQEILEQRRMQRDIQSLADHVIVCGLSRTGEQVIAELLDNEVPLVLIERDREVVDSHQGLPRVPWLHGDAREDEVLVRAGIERARSIVICLMSDADNVFITLSARQLNPKVSIVAQANMAHTESKLRTAGADRVISLNTIGGMRLAATVLRPSIVDFLDVITSGETGLAISALNVHQDSPLLDQSLAESGIRRRSGAIILAVKREGRFTYNPDPQQKLRDGDVLLALGNDDQLDRLHAIVGDEPQE